MPWQRILTFPEDLNKYAALGYDEVLVQAAKLTESTLRNYFVTARYFLTSTQFRLCCRKNIANECPFLVVDDVFGYYGEKRLIWAVAADTIVEDEIERKNVYWLCRRHKVEIWLPDGYGSWAEHNYEESSIVSSTNGIPGSHGTSTAESSTATPTTGASSSTASSNTGPSSTGLSSTGSSTAALSTAALVGMGLWPWVGVGGLGVGGVWVRGARVGGVRVGRPVRSFAYRVGPVFGRGLGLCRRLPMRLTARQVAWCQGKSGVKWFCV